MEEETFFDQQKAKHQHASEYESRRANGRQANRKTLAVKSKTRKKHKRFKSMRSKSLEILNRLTSLYNPPDEEPTNNMSTREVMDKIPLAEDEEFLKVIKEELLGLKKRLRHETLQKLQLLKQIKDFRTREVVLQGKAAKFEKL